MATVGNSDCVVWLLKGKVCVCCGYLRKQCVCAVGTVGNIGFVLLLL